MCEDLAPDPCRIRSDRSSRSGAASAAGTDSSPKRLLIWAATLEDLEGTMKNAARGCRGQGLEVRKPGCLGFLEAFGTLCVSPPAEM